MYFGSNKRSKSKYKYHLIGICVCTLDPIQSTSKSCASKICESFATDKNNSKMFKDTFVVCLCHVLYRVLI